MMSGHSRRRSENPSSVLPFGRQLLQHAIHGLEPKAPTEQQTAETSQRLGFSEVSFEPLSRQAQGLLSLRPVIYPFIHESANQVLREAFSPQLPAELLAAGSAGGLTARHPRAGEFFVIDETGSS